MNTYSFLSAGGQVEIHKIILTGMESKALMKQDVLVLKMNPAPGNVLILSVIFGFFKNFLVKSKHKKMNL